MRRPWPRTRARARPSSRDRREIGGATAVGYVRVRSLTEGGYVAWVLRLVEIGAEGEGGGGPSRADDILDPAGRATAAARRTAHSVPTRLCSDELLLDASQELLTLGQAQAQGGQVREVVRSGDPHDLRAAFGARGPDAYQLHDPGHAVSASPINEPESTLLDPHLQSRGGPFGDRIAHRSFGEGGQQQQPKNFASDYPGRAPCPPVLLRGSEGPTGAGGAGWPLAYAGQPR